jgi:hypothetical protein
MLMGAEGSSEIRKAQRWSAVLMDTNLKWKMRQIYISVSSRI